MVDAAGDPSGARSEARGGTDRISPRRRIGRIGRIGRRDRDRLERGDGDERAVDDGVGRGEAQAVAQAPHRGHAHVDRFGREEAEEIALGRSRRGVGGVAVVAAVAAVVVARAGVGLALEGTGQGVDGAEPPVPAPDVPEALEPGDLALERLGSCGEELTPVVERDGLVVRGGARARGAPADPARALVDEVHARLHLGVAVREPARERRRAAHARDARADDGEVAPRGGGHRRRRGRGTRGGLLYTSDAADDQ